MNERDLEFLSAYLDGQLTPAESASLESRIHSNPELDSVLADLRATRGILRKLPKRRSPRNFTLTRKMVGLNPPLPRSYSFFQFATAFASLLLVLTFAANILSPRLSYVGQVNGGFGGGGGYGGSGLSEPFPPQMAAPAATEAPMMEVAATEAAATESAAADLLPLPTMSADAAAENSAADSQMEKSSGAENSAPQSQIEGEKSALISIEWQIGFLVITLISAAMMFVLRQSVKQKWQ